MYVQRITKGSYMYHLPTAEKTICSKSVMKEKNFVSYGMLLSNLGWIW